MLISLPGDFCFDLCHCRKHLVVLSVPWHFRFGFHTLLALFSHFCLLWLTLVINQRLVHLSPALSQGSPRCMLTVRNSFFRLTQMVAACMQNELTSASPGWERIGWQIKPRLDLSHECYRNFLRSLQCFCTSLHSLDPKVPGSCHSGKCDHKGSAKGMAASYKSFMSGNSSVQKNK